MGLLSVIWVEVQSTCKYDLRAAREAYTDQYRMSRISYRVAENEPTVLEEATVGSGDKCGGSFVERGFLKWLERRLGTADFVMIAGEKSEDLPRTSMSPKLSRMVQDFVSEAKSGFTGVETNYLRLPPPLSGIEEDEARGILDGEIKITPLVYPNIITTHD